ncbi:transposase, partial [Ligilactobacillus aviarius]
DDYFVNCNGVRFNFLRYSVRHDSYGFERKFKVYAAEKYDENHQVIPDSLTPKGHVKKIYINPEWEYFKNKAKDKLSSSEGKALYYQRKFDVEPVFGTLKASLRFTRFTVRGLSKVNRQMALVIMAWNMKKLTNKIGQFCEYQFNLKEKIAKSNFLKLNFAIFITEAVY